MLYIYQVFRFLQNHLYFSCIFSSGLWRTFLRNILYHNYFYNSMSVFCILSAEEWGKERYQCSVQASFQPESASEAKLLNQCEFISWINRRLPKILIIRTGLETLSLNQSFLCLQYKTSVGHSPLTALLQHRQSNRQVSILFFFSDEVNVLI